MSKQSTGDYKVGRGRPPKHTQFQPGTSGNPRGRPKGQRNVKTDLLEELSERVTITENGKKKKLSKQRIFLKQLCSRAIAGESNAGKLLASMMMAYLTEEAQTEERIDTLPEEDQAILDRYTKRPK